MQDSPIRNCPRNATPYAWREGDTVQTVMASRGITSAELIAANPDVDFTSLMPGVVICLPLGPRTDSDLTGGPVLDGTGNDNNTVTPQRPGGPVLDGTGNDNNTVTPQQPGGPVLDGTGNDNNTVTPQQPGTPIVIVPVRPGQAGLSCPIGYNGYTVRRGQTYADLLVDLNVSYNALRASNPGLDPARLVAGTRFCAPPAGTRQICPRPTRSYTIQPGETLAMVAEKFGTSQGRLLMLNPTLVPTDFSSGTVVCVP